MVLEVLSGALDERFTLTPLATQTWQRLRPGNVAADAGRQRRRADYRQPGLHLPDGFAPTCPEHRGDGVSAAQRL
jgi:hypothetical protein